MYVCMYVGMGVSACVFVCARMYVCACVHTSNCVSDYHLECFVTFAI